MILKTLVMKIPFFWLQKHYLCYIRTLIWALRRSSFTLFSSSSAAIWNTSSTKNGGRNRGYYQNKSSRTRTKFYRYKIYFTTSFLREGHMSVGDNANMRWSSNQPFKRIFQYFCEANSLRSLEWAITLRVFFIWNSPKFIEIQKILSHGHSPLNSGAR